MEHELETDAIRRAQWVVGSLGDIYLGENEFLEIPTRMHYSQEEMKLARRLDLVKHSFGMQNQQVKDFVNFIGVNANQKVSMEVIDRFSDIHSMQRGSYDFEDTRFTLEPNGSPVDAFSSALRGMKRISAAVQTTEVIAINATDEAIKEKYEGWMEQCKQAVRKSPYATLIACAEYATGLSDVSPLDQPLTPEVTDFLGQMGIHRDTLREMNQLSQSYQLDQPLSAIDFSFVNTNNLAVQNHLNHPSRWYKRYSQVPRDFEQEDVAEKMIGASWSQTASNAINPLFEKFEQGKPIHKTEQGINRARLTIVGGKTVEEIMREEHRKAMADVNDPNQLQDFSDYFAQHYEKDTSRIVAAGLAADKRVEVFIPNKEGKIKDSVQVVKKGEVPTALTPVAYHGWHKFMSRFGFYQDSMNKQQEYEDTIKKRELVKEHVNEVHCNTKIATGEKIKNANVAFVRSKGDYVDAAQLNQLTNAPIQFSYSRTAIQSFGATQLLNRGHKVEDIFNPNALLAEKQQAGADIVQHAMANDRAWFANLIHRGQVEWFMQYQGRTPMVHQLDDSPHIGTLEQMTSVTFDLDQETRCVKAEYNAIPNGPARQFMDPENKVNDIAVKHRFKKLELSAFTNVMNNQDSKLSSEIVGKAPLSQILLGQTLDKIEEKNGNVNMQTTRSPLTGEVFSMFRSQVIGNEHMGTLHDLCAKDSKVFAIVKKQIQDDTFRDNFAIDIKRGRGNEITEIKCEMRDTLLKKVVDKEILDQKKQLQKGLQR